MLNTTCKHVSLQQHLIGKSSTALGARKRVIRPLNDDDSFPPGLLRWLCWGRTWRRWCLWLLCLLLELQLQSKTRDVLSAIASDWSQRRKHRIK